MDRGITQTKGKTMQTPTTIPTVSFEAETLAIACVMRHAFRAAGIVCGTIIPTGSGYIVRVAAEQEAQAQSIVESI